MSKSSNASNQKSVEGRTPFAIAARYGHEDEGQYLIKQNYPEINYKDDKGQTSLMLAEINNYISIIRLLLKKGVDASIQDNEKKKAIQLCKSSSYPNCEVYCPIQK